jgi:hypothetical protein
MDLQIKISLFLRARKDWEGWSITFLAKSRLKGYWGLKRALNIAPVKGTKGDDKFVTKNGITYARLLIAL